jgi:thiol:disulfide interchange protein DsbD
VLLKAKVDWLVCRESCIPGKAELELKRTILREPPMVESAAPADAELFKRLGNSLPQPLPQGSKLGFAQTSDGFRLTVETGRRESAAQFFPLDQDIIDNPAEQKFTATAHGFTLDLKKDSQLNDAPKQLRGVIELSGGRAYEIVALPGLAAVKAGAVENYDSTAGSAKPAAGAPEATGNAVATPAQTAVEASSVRTNEPVPPAASQNAALSLWKALGLAFLGGIILNLMPCVFPVLFLKGLSLAQSGSEERGKLRLHGLVYTAGILVSFWILVGTLLGLRAAGATLGWGFQFQSPVFLSLMAGLLFFLGLSLAGQFEFGLSLTSAGGGLAQKQGFAGSFFTGVLAVIVATPCTAPLMGAAVGYALAQSALTALLVFTALALGLAAPYLALTLQPAWTRILPRPGVWMEILKQATSIPIFATVIWLSWVLARAYGAEVLAALLAGFLLLAIAGWFLGRWPGRRIPALVAAVFVLAAVALAFAAQKFANAKEDAPQGEVAEQSSAVAARSAWSETVQAQAIASGRPVFVDFTASWCLSCQVNERTALQAAEVQKRFREKNVLLLKADWTRHDEAITAALKKLGRSGVPTYVYYAPSGQSPRLLPEALTPGIVLEALK